MIKKELAGIIALCAIAVVVVAVVVTLPPKSTLPPTVEPVVLTGDCTDHTTTSLRAHGDLIDDGGDWVIRRGFQYSEGESEDFPDIIHLANPGFEYGTPAPTGWDIWQGEASRTTEQVKVGSYAIKFTVDNDRVGGVNRAIAEYLEYEGKVMKLGCWVWADTGARVRIQVGDRIGDWWDWTRSEYHPGDSQWHWITVTRAIRSGIDAIRVDLLRMDEGSAITAYADGAVLVQGSELKLVFDDGGFVSGAYSIIITDLEPDTWYSIRAFADNEAGVTYGNTVNCKTAGD